MNYCPSCGTANRDGSRFCNECGHKLPSKTGIMCPMCSHMNPAANVYCDKCHARLVPASPSSPAEPPPGIGVGSQAERVDPASLKKGLSLPTRSAPVEPPPEPTREAEPAPVEEETPDWLLRLRAAVPKPSESASAEPEAVPSAESPETDTGIPAWMRPNEGEVPDWFARLSGEQETPAAAGPPAPPAAEEQADWMRELGSAPSPAPSGDEVPGVPKKIADTRPTPAEEEIPGWLHDLDVGPPAETTPKAAAAPPPEAAAAEEPDWLRSLRGSEPAGAPASAAETPDWLRDVQGLPPVEEHAESGAVEEPEGLRSLRGPAPAEAPAEPASVEEPDWLRSLRSLTASEAEVKPTPAEEPDWLTGLREPTPSEAPAGTPGAQPEAPDWLKEIGEAAAQPIMPAATEAPDWLIELGAEQAAPAATEAAPSLTTGPVSAFIGDEIESLAQGEAPEWLSGVEQTAPLAEAAPAQPTELPAWLRDLGPMPSGAALAEESPFGEVTPATPGEVPLWLQEKQPFAAEISAPGEPAVSAGLESAEIPTWLQALRPHELAPQPAAAGVVETEGLLTGLANVLPASPFMGQAYGAAAVTKAQPAADQARASLFQEILARGSLTPVTAGEGGKTGLGDRIARWLIAAVFVLIVYLPNVNPFASAFFQLGAVDSGLFQPAADQVQALSAGDRVLMIFDYDATQAGEMNTIAEAFVRHIGLRGAEVVAGSLNPIGPALANRVLQKVTAGESPAPAFVNQGYLPGQAVGAQKMLLSNPAKIIIVMAGSPESLRWWAEQVTAARLPTPIVAGLSASTLPQAMPYLQSGQIRTAVSGLMSGLAYQRFLDPKQDAPPDGFDRVVRSEALILSQIAFALILLVGAVISFLSRPRSSA